MQMKASPASTKVSWAAEWDAASMLGNSAGVTQLRSTKQVWDWGRRVGEARIAAPGAKPGCSMCTTASTARDASSPEGGSRTWRKISSANTVLVQNPSGRAPPSNE